jgi:D-alanyl-lipoteichoic acid acyltransferase DltB (MBOAT superfamily)
MSYSLDIYLKKLRPTKDFISFASFVSFFPQLVAGPIERASNLLPQILRNRGFKYDQGVHGLRLILWGMFKKVVIADSLGPRVDLIFQNYQIYDGGILFLGLVYFSFQIYCDFSGYSDIAIGTAKLFGINLRKNFNLPYFSKNIKDFWKRWHISLSSWFRDYLYIPLGGSKEGKWLSLRNIFIVFIVSGFWHGANWTFIIWGLLHALLYTPFFLLSRITSVKKKRSLKKLRFPFIGKIIQIFFTYLTTTIAWAFFRSENLFDAFNYLIIIFTQFSYPSQFRKEIVYVLIVIIIEIFIYLEISSIFKIRNKFFTYLIYSFLLYTIFEKIQLVHSIQFLYFSF